MTPPAALVPAVPEADKALAGERRLEVDYVIRTRRICIFLEQRTFWPSDAVHAFGSVMLGVEACV